MRALKPQNTPLKESTYYMYDNARDARPKNCEKINKVREQSAPKIYAFSNVLRRKKLSLGGPKAPV